MKKLFALLLTLAMLLSSAAMAEFDYIGLWTLIGMETAGIPMDVSTLGLYGSMLLNEDGSCVLTMQDKTQNGTWAATATGITTTDAEGVVDIYTLVNNNLVVEQEGVKIIFAREAAEKIDYVGVWVLTSLKASGVTLDPAKLGMEATMDIYENGTCTMVSMGETEQGTWAETEGGIVITDEDGEPLALTVTDGALAAEQDGVTMIFTPLVPAEEEEYAVPLAGLTMADFNGEWVFVDAEYMDQVLDAETLGMSIDLHIQDGKGHVEMVYEDGTEAYDAVCEIEEVINMGTVMYFLYTDPATGEATEYGMMLLLYNDGELVWWAADEENNDIFYNFENTANIPE